MVLLVNIFKVSEVDRPTQQILLNMSNNMTSNNLYLKIRFGDNTAQESKVYHLVIWASKFCF